MYIVRIHMFIYIYTHIYIVQKRPSHPIPRLCHAYKVDTSPTFQHYHAEKIGYTTPKNFNLEGSCQSSVDFLSSFFSPLLLLVEVLLQKFLK